MATFEKISNIYRKCFYLENRIDDDKFNELTFFERANILVDYILFNKKDNQKTQNIINSALKKEDNKLILSHDDIKYVGTLLFERFYVKYQAKAWNKYINFIDKNFSFDNRWFDIYLPFLKTSKEYFIQNALNYIIENQDTKWKEKFQEIDYEKYTWIRPLEYLPETFESFLDLYIWIENNRIKDHLDFIENKSVSILLWKVIENDLLQIYKYGFSAKSFENIKKLLKECKNDYKILSDIFTTDVLPLKLWFLNNIETVGIGLISLQSLGLGINTFDRKSKFDLEYEKIIAKEINNFIFENIKTLQFKREYAKIFANVICFYDNHINFDNVNFLYKELLNFLVEKEIYQNPYEKEKFITLIFDEFYKEYLKCFDFNSFYSLSKIISFVKKEHQEKLTTLFINSLKKEIKWYNEKLLENIDYNSLIKYIDIEKLLQLNPQNEYTIKFYFHLLLNIYKHLHDIRIREKLVDTFFKCDKNLYFLRNPFIEVDFVNKFFQLDFDEKEVRKITDFLNDFSLLVRFYNHQRNDYIKKKILSFSSFTLNDIKESLLYLGDNNLNDLANKIHLKFKDKIDCKSHRYKEFCLTICNHKLVEIFKSDETLEKKIVSLNQVLQNFKFNDRHFNNESKDIQCENYKQFLVALLYFEEDTEKSFKILQDILEKEQNRLYLYNMLNILLKLENKEKLETYLNKLKDYDASFKYEKSEFEYFTLLNVYMFLDKKDKFEQLWQEIPLYIKQKEKFKNLIENYENETISDVTSLTQYIKNYENKRFDFAFSFAGSNNIRSKIKKIKNELQEKNYQVFYDEDFTSEMQKVIHPKKFLEWVFKTSKYVIMIVDKNYIKKINLECDFEKFRQKCYVKFEFEIIKKRINNYGRKFLIMFKNSDISLNEYGLNSDVPFNMKELNTETILRYFKEK